MAFDYKSLIDNKTGAAEFDRPEFDPKAARKPFLSLIDRSIKGYEAGKLPRKDNALYSVSNNWAKVKPVIGERSITIDGHEVAHVQHERLGEFFKGMRADVEAGAFDDQLKGSEGVVAKVARKVRGALSPEALEARRAKMAANGTAKKK